MMIVYGDMKVKPGTVIHPAILTTSDGFRIKPQPLFVIREAAREEYAAQSPPHAAADPHLYYYVATTD